MSLFLKKSNIVDVLILSIFTVLITLQPYFMHGRINVFEVGLYLPGIQGVLDGQIPFRDFFHLRGPFELYMPALMMKIFGEHLTVLYSYFYMGNVLCLIICILIARELIKTRFVLYLFTLVLIARTFPRVVFTFWGGMRHALALIALWCAVRYFTKQKNGWMFAAGLASVTALFTSIEMGAYCFVGVVAAFAVSWGFRVQDTRSVFKGIGAYALGCGLIAVPYLIYLAANSALVPYIDSTLSVVFNMQKVIDPHLGAAYPRNFAEALTAMTNPTHINFKHMTPSYLFLAVLGYLTYRLRQRKFSFEEVAIVCIGSYGFIMYNTGFRGIWTSHFEMSLQPEKILLFFLLEQFYLYLIDQRRNLLAICRQNKEKALILNWSKIHGIHFLILAFFMSSVCYSIARYNHRFVAYKILRNLAAGKDVAPLKPLADQPAQVIGIPRAKGILAPVDQARDLEQIDRYVRDHVRQGEAVLTYPELGAYNFFFDRPPFGGFPIPTFTWFNDSWHRKFMQRLKSRSPRYIIVQKDLPDYWEKIYMSREPNRRKFNDVMDFIHDHYDLKQETALSYIYHLKQ